MPDLIRHPEGLERTGFRLEFIPMKIGAGMRVLIEEAIYKQTLFKLMGLLILFGRIGDRVGLPIARAKTPNLPANEAGTPLLVPLIPLQKLPVRFSPGGLDIGIYFLDILLPSFYIRLIPKRVLSAPGKA